MLPSYVPYDIVHLSDARFREEFEEQRCAVRRARHSCHAYMIYLTLSVLAMYEEEARWRAIEREAFGEVQ